LKATRLKGIQDFKVGTYGLHPIAVDTWGDLVFLHLQGGAGKTAGEAVVPPSPPGVGEWLGTVPAKTTFTPAHSGRALTYLWTERGKPKETMPCEHKVTHWDHYAWCLALQHAVLCCAVLCCAVVAPAGAGGRRMHEVGMSDSSLVHLTRREYVINCNWKVFADNYLDGGYHVSTTATAACRAAVAQACVSLQVRSCRALNWRVCAVVLW
jgi:hypothetical protein